MFKVCWFLTLKCREYGLTWWHYWQNSKVSLCTLAFPYQGISPQCAKKSHLLKGYYHYWKRNWTNGCMCARIINQYSGAPTGFVVCRCVIGRFPLWGGQSHVTEWLCGWQGIRWYRETVLRTEILRLPLACVRYSTWWQSNFAFGMGDMNGETYSDSSAYLRVCFIH